MFDVVNIEKTRCLICISNYRLGFSVFLNSGNASENAGYDNNEFMPEACQISLDYAGKQKIKEQYRVEC